MPRAQKLLNHHQDWLHIYTTRNSVHVPHPTHSVCQFFWMTTLNWGVNVLAVAFLLQACCACIDDVGCSHGKCVYDPGLQMGVCECSPQWTHTPLGVTTAPCDTERVPPCPAPMFRNASTQVCECPPHLQDPPLCETCAQGFMGIQCLYRVASSPNPSPSPPLTPTPSPGATPLQRNASVCPWCTGSARCRIVELADGSPMGICVCPTGQILQTQRIPGSPMECMDITIQNATQSLVGFKCVIEAWIKTRIYKFPVLVSLAPLVSMATGVVIAAGASYAHKKWPTQCRLSRLRFLGYRPVSTSSDSLYGSTQTYPS